MELLLSEHKNAQAPGHLLYRTFRFTMTQIKVHTNPVEEQAVEKPKIALCPL